MEILARGRERVVLKVRWRRGVRRRREGRKAGIIWIVNVFVLGRWDGGRWKVWWVERLVGGLKVETLVPFECASRCG